MAVKESKASKLDQPAPSPSNGEDADKKTKGVLYIGIDLGTSRTSVSASNGQRETVYSYVGYPKDVVARKLLKKDVLFGKEAIEKRMSLDLYRPFEGGIIKFSTDENQSIPRDQIEKHMKAAKDLVKHALSLCKPRKDELLFAVIGAPARASMKNKEQIIEAASEYLDAVMIASEPFTVAYGLDLLEDTLVIDIGAGTVDLCRMHGTMPADEDQITLTTAGDWLDKQLFAALKKKAPNADFTIHKVKEIKEKHAFVSDAAEAVKEEFLVNGKPTVFDITDEIRTSCRKIIPPIVEAIHKLISSFDPDFQKKLRENVLLGGGGSQIVGLGRVLEETMKQMLGSGRVTHVEEPMYAGANGALKMAHDMPEEYWKKLS
ncbi:MAG TPA: MamK family actin-like protein [Planctomycetota bacterium]|nr:MamK family actin-like protein [Planctomycetota bacterium]